MVQKNPPDSWFSKTWSPPDPAVSQMGKWLSKQASLVTKDKHSVKVVQVTPPKRPPGHYAQTLSKTGRSNPPPKQKSFWGHQAQIGSFTWVLIHLSFDLSEF